ncbi:unnamed protein product [Caenorhabditis angaria]|uniref:Uncharacterized protein n=1 Tax=Caenorhabditis angaria TaxID=860376 RepID=A0A9P1IY90_9PELO|nr:unnamed protein product [Caenorhabditis angaria]
MIDPLMLGVVGVIVVGLVAVLGYFFSSKDESDFEKKFQEHNGNALKLLSENGKKEKKQQQNPPKAKGEKKKVKKEEAATPTPQTTPTTESPKVTVTPPPKVVAPKVEEVKVQVKVVEPEIAKKVESVPVLSENVAPKKKSPKVVNLKDLDAKKLLAKLNNTENLEPEYVQFLTGYLKDVDTQKTNLSNEVKAVTKKMNDHAQKLDKLQKEKGSLENKQREEQLKSANLAAKVQQLAQSEQILKQQLTTLSATYQRNETTLSQDLSAIKSRFLEQEKELVAVRSANQKLAKEVRTAAMQVNEADVTNLKAQFGNFEKVSNELKADILKKKEIIDQLVQDLAKRDSKLAEFEGEKQEWLKKEKALKQEYFNVSNMVKSLNGEIHQFVAFKEQQEKVIGELRLKEQEFEKYKQEEASRIVEIPRNSPPPPQVQEEIFELKKTTVDLAATPSSSKNDEEFNKIKEEKEKLQAKVEELRARNIAILEKVEEAEKKSKKPTTESKPQPEFDIEGERKQVVETVGKLAAKKFDKLKDNKAYSKWLQDSVAHVEKQLAAAQKRPESQPQPQVIVENNNKPIQTKPEDAGYYRGVIQNLLAEISRIEKLAV